MQEFPIVPANIRPFLYFVVPVTLIVAFAVGLLFKSVAGARNSTFTVAGDSLRLRGDLYGRTLALSELRAAEARIVNLASEPQLQPRRRTIGTALPGYQSGWFRLRNGEKALLYLTDRSRAVYVPTSRGFSLLLSPRNPEAFVAAIRGNAQS